MSACDKCRRLHRKCDLAQPRCGLCERTGVECLNSIKRLRFKKVQHVEVASPNTQRISGKIRYVHETDRTVQAHHSRRQPSQENWPSPSPSGPTPLSPSDDTQETRRSRREYTPAPGIAESSETFHTSSGSVAPSPETQTRVPLETPCNPPTRCWSFKDATEVLLFQHFTRCLSSFFDLCDPDHHFAIQIPVRARVYPPLMDAILALSARHMSLVGNEVDSFLASHYYQRCLNILIPELDSVHDERVDDLLAATIILRLHEELDGPFSGLDTTYRHSIGTHALLQNRASHGSSVSGLRRAAFWAGMRQEIYASIKRHHPPVIRASAEMLSHFGPLETDSAWAESAVSHCLDVLDFCFGDDSMNADLYDTVCERIMRWEVERPASYDPLCFEVGREPDDESNSSWDVRYHGDWHASAWAYISLAGILLVIHNPRQPRVGLNRVAAWKNVLKEVHSKIKLLCSIAQCRPEAPGPSLVACMAVWLAGDMVEDRRERKRILELLARTEAVHGWPTQDICTELVGLWES